MLKPVSLAVLTAALIAGAALAHEHATGIIAARMTAMTNMGRELKAIGEMLAGDTPIDKAALVRHTEALHDNCHHVEAMFPPGSIDHHSHALPDIWSKPGFAEQMRRLHEATEGMVAIAQAGDTAKLKASFEEVKSTCNSCHEAFRAPED
jgi:cytochrome c556